MDRDLNFSSPESLAVELDQSRVSVSHCIFICGHSVNTSGSHEIFFSKLGVVEAMRSRGFTYEHFTKESHRNPARTKEQDIASGTSAITE